MARKSSKDIILDAAEQVIGKNGLANTTVDAVVAEAGVSKGGFFYHFASKKEMLLTLMDRYEERFRQLRDEIYRGLPEGRARLLKATIIASINHPARHNNASNMVTLLDDVDLRDKIAEMKVSLFEEVSKGFKHPEKIILALLVTEGLWVTEMFGKPIVNDKYKKYIVNELLGLIDRFVGEMDGKTSAKKPAAVGEDK